MEVRNIRIEPGPDRGTMRLQADVHYDPRLRRRGSVHEQIWFEVDERFAHSLSNRADPWLAFMLPFAALDRDPVMRIPGVASRKLHDSIPRILSIWKSWYPELGSEVNIECEGVSDAVEHKEPKTGVFFSGGVDSWFSLLKGDSEGEGVDSLVAVMGWDIPLSNVDAVTRMIKSHQGVAQATGKELVVVKTNMRALRYGEKLWGALMHGAALATVGHVVASHFNRLLIASSHSTDMLFPWGSHPETDHLFSSEAVAFVHHLPQFTRVQKTTYIAKHQTALDHLHVCWVEWDDTNCGRCEKCLRTMTTLEILGALERAKSFPVRRVVPQDLRRVKAYKTNVRGFFKEIRDLARAAGRHDLADALDRCMRRGRVYRWLKNCVPEVIGGKDRILGKPLRAIWKRL